MKNTIILAALAASLLAATDAFAQGQNTGKGRRVQSSQNRSIGQYPDYGYDDRYGKNHGSYQGRGKKKGHYKNKHNRDDRDMVYRDRSNRPVIYRDRNVQPAPQPTPRGIWDILGGRTQ